jgi:hypothetical protein
LNKNHWYGIGAALVCALGLGSWWTLKGVSPTPPIGGFHFHPDAVRTLKWSLGDETVVFTRGGRESEWSPMVQPQLIQRRLNLLGTATVIPLTVTGTKLEVVLEFSDGQVWKGVYGRQLFAWIEGPLKGFGFEADGLVSDLFEAGRFAFRDQQFSLCKSRWTRLSFPSKDDKIEIKVSEAGWTLSKNQGPPTTIDATFGEKWLGRHCQFEVSAFRDLKNFPLPLGLSFSKLVIESPQGTEEWGLRSGFWKVDGDLALRSTKLTEALSEFLTFLGKD